MKHVMNRNDRIGAGVHHRRNEPDSLSDLDDAEFGGAGVRVGGGAVVVR
jgi:hypothetical protein